MNGRCPMKINVTLKIDIDPESWDLAYGTGTEPAAVEADVRQYVLNGVQQSAAGQERAIVGATLVAKRTRPVR